MATPAHCLSCFAALDAHLSHRKPPSLEEIESSYALYAASPSKPASAAIHRVADSSSASSSSPSSTPSTPATSVSSSSSLALGTSSSASAPLFVTWNTIDDDDDDDDDNVSLRGCIGTFESQALSVAVPEYALVSGLQDSRFPPISKKELPTLQVAVTLLTDFEDAQDPYDWEIGVHGIRLSFVDGGRRYGATYLPDVASEQGWSQDETLYSLIRKAGWTGGRAKWKDLHLKVTRYQGKKTSLSYAEYKKWTDWRSNNQ